MSKKVYYAHFMGIYNTLQEQRDIATLEALDLEVVNPNRPGMNEQFELAKIAHNNDYIKAFDSIFGKLVRECDVFAFRSLPDGRIPGGVAVELNTAKANNKLIIELPSATLSRQMNGEETREYLRDMGQR
jgi:hypothetical protein